MRLAKAFFRAAGVALFIISCCWFVLGFLHGRDPRDFPTEEITITTRLFAGCFLMIVGGIVVGLPSAMLVGVSYACCVWRGIPLDYVKKWCATSAVLGALFGLATNGLLANSIARKWINPFDQPPLESLTWLLECAGIAVLSALWVCLLFGKRQDSGKANPYQ